MEFRSQNENSGGCGSQIPTSRFYIPLEPSTYCALTESAKTLCRFSLNLLRDQDRRSEKGFKCPRIRPPAVQDVVLHPPLLDVGIVDVRDLQFAAGGWLEP